MKTVLLDILRPRLKPPGQAWLDKALRAAQPPVNPEALLLAYSGASRWAGKLALALTPEETRRAAQVAPESPLSHWGADEAARSAILLSLPAEPPAERDRLALLCFEKGDSREQEGWLRGVALLPGAERFLATVIDACRTNILPVFQAVACENPYPARCFPELNFNQMVLKSLFNGTALERIAGLERRLNPELSRMADDYAAEREAAGRQVPVDLWLVQAPHSQGEALARALRYLEHEEAGHRFWCARGLALRRGGAPAELVARCLKAEPNARVRQALEALRPGGAA